MDAIAWRRPAGLLVASVVLLLLLGLLARAKGATTRLYHPSPEDTVADWLWRIDWFALVACLLLLGWSSALLTARWRRWELHVLGLGLGTLLIAPMLWFGTIVDFGDVDFAEERAIRSVVLWLPVGALAAIVVGCAGIGARAAMARWASTGSAHPREDMCT